MTIGSPTGSRTGLSNAKRALLDQWLAGRQRMPVAGEPAPRPPGVSDIPLSFAQERMWFLYQLDPESPLYNVPMPIWLRAAINEEALEQSINGIVRRHEALRTRFALGGDGPVQIVEPAVHIPLSVHDLRKISEPEQAAELEHLVRVETRRPFDLASGPLLRATLVRLGSIDSIGNSSSLNGSTGVLLLVTHHIVADGWSMAIFHRELSRLYRWHAEGIPDQLPELPIQYADYAIWQRSRLTSEMLDRQLAYWKQHLEGAPPLLALPMDFRRPSIQGADGASQALMIERDIARGIAELGRLARATPFMTLFAALAVLLYRLSGQEDIVIGTPIAGRSNRNTEQLIGCFLNTMALRTKVRTGMSFLEILHDVREAALGGFAHADLPFERLLEALQPQRSTAWTPVFQVFLNMLNYAEARVDLPGGELPKETLEGPAEALARFDLTFYAEETAEGLHLKAVYRTELFTHARISEMLAQYRLLLQKVAAAPSAPIESHELVTATERTLLPDPRQSLPVRSWQAIHRFITRRATGISDHIAISDEARSWTYGELRAESSALATRLRQLGVGPGEVVAIFGKRSPAHAIAILGVLQAGTAFMILEPSHPVARLIACLRLAKPRGWINLVFNEGSETGDQLPEELASFLDRQSLKARLCLREAGTGMSGQPETMETPATDPSPDSLAYLAFTSGTTGVPRAIEGLHAPLSHFVDWHITTFGLRAADRFSCVSGLSHDPLLRDILTPLALGATLCMPAEEDFASAARLAEWVNRERISVMHLTPAMGTILLDGARAIAQARGRASLPSLRHLFFGGDVLDGDFISALRPFAPNAEIVNFYGTTETPQAMAWYSVPPDTAMPLMPSMPLGRGIDGAQLIIQSAPGVQAGIGELGQIHIRSPYLSRGYRDDPDLTTRLYIANPFRSAPEAAGDRMFQTGDLGRYLPDGNVVFFGRADEQIKIRGFRVELGDIIAALEQHPMVKQARILAEQTHAGCRLIAYAVRQEERESSTVTEADVVHFLRLRLPDYMIPASIVWLEHLPLTSNGKIDRRALPAANPGHRRITRGAAPRSETERVLCGIWSDVLGLEQIGIDDNFFDLGGHSLAAIRVLAAIMARLKVDLPLRRIFDASTVAQLACAVSAAQECHAQPPLAIERLSREQHRLHASPVCTAPERGETK
jgi:amino acid adenylation domain-containing protein